MNDYERIARIIRHLDTVHGEQPNLKVLARTAGLSPFHFHRLFSRWASVTPKDFLQCLTLAHARALLLSGESVLDTAIDSGLSGPGRLHDLCVTLDCATPGEIKTGGDGWTISFGFAESPFGCVVIGQNRKGICHLAFTDALSEAGAIAEIRSDWPNAHLERDDQRAAMLSACVFDGDPARGKARPLRAYVRGTRFQVRVWRALLRVPAGSLVTYGRLAEAIGNPGAARAVGAAVGRNPLAYLIPCHRVIRETGVIGGYHWGVTRKRAMIARESGKGRGRQRRRSTCGRET